jgi:uncharacterized membrane-anchored protein
MRGWNQVATLFPIPENHPQRFILHNEVHARASLILELPVRASHLALLLSTDERIQERKHLAALCERFGITPPKQDADHFSAALDSFRIRWGQHGEFSTYTFYVQDSPEDPFSKPALAKVPVDWLAMLPGKVMAAIHAAIIVKPDNESDLEPGLQAVSGYFEDNPLIGSKVTGGAASAFTDFRIHADGFSRFLIIDHRLTPEQAGRLLQRLFEIEVYRVMALLAFPIARRLGPELKKADRQLYAITSAMAQPDRDDAELLDELTHLAAEVENHISSSHFRFGAANAYYQIVEQRLDDLREVRIQGIQTLSEFIGRRMEPAIRTCQSTARRFTLISERVSNAGQLLRTRVDIIIERQNQALLTSMDRRAKMQLRLQETVEGISVVAITYYSAGLVGMIAKAAYAAGWPINPELAVGLSLPFIMAIVILGIRRIHKMIKTTTT